MQFFSSPTIKKSRSETRLINVFIHNTHANDAWLLDHLVYFSRLKSDGQSKT